MHSSCLCIAKFTKQIGLGSRRNQLHFVGDLSLGFFFPIAKLPFKL